MVTFAASCSNHLLFKHNLVLSQSVSSYLSYYYLCLPWLVTGNEKHGNYCSQRKCLSDCDSRKRTKSKCKRATAKDAKVSMEERLPEDTAEERNSILRAAAHDDVGDDVTQVSAPFPFLPFFFARLSRPLHGEARKSRRWVLRYASLHAYP